MIEGVAFDVGLVPDVESVLIAEIVEFRGIGIVAGADGVDVELLHQLQVALDMSAAYGSSGMRRAFVAVHAGDQHRLAVDQQLPFRNFHPPEADFDRGVIHLFTVGSLKRDAQRIKLGRFGAPLPDLRNGHFDGAAGFPAAMVMMVAGCFVQCGGGGKFPHQFFAVVKPGHEAPRHRHGARPGQGGDGGDFEPPGGIVVVQRGDGEKVRQRIARHADEINVAHDAAVPPLILILKVTAVRPFEHQNAQLIVAVGQKRGEIEFGRIARAFGETYRMTVQADLKIAFHAVEVNPNPAVAPGLRQPERTPVEAGWIAFRHRRRQFGKRHPDIGIVRVVVTLQGPRSGNRNRAPVGGIGIEVGLRQNGRVFGITEVPISVQAQLPWSAFRSSGGGQRLGFGVVMKKCGMRRQTAGTRRIGAAVEQRTEIFHDFLRCFLIFWYS
ncbi:hypothetical protein SDC9_121500 [bioreactor metagenome]|uniref:Uncharacterized protein n=1 Tax=bioreactor metagenome TaxID=1076179 RepID=A0A645CCA7_9ZZZZ